MKLPALLSIATLALSVSACASSPDVDCGPITGTIPVADGQATSDLARVQVADARAAALAATPGAIVTDVDLDEEDGFLVYEVELAQDRAAFDVVVDAGSGEVLCSERD